MPRLFTYIVAYDIGFAPNPFFDYCTLATCKPGIRKGAVIGDWIAGVGSKTKGQFGRLVYAMEVEEKLSFEEYWCDPRFERKKPNRVGSLKQRYGDNIYHRDADGETWVQEDGRHSLEDGSPNMGHVRRDTNPPRVLISQRFVYYGSEAAEIPATFRQWDGFDVCSIVRNYRCDFSDGFRASFIEWLDNQVDLGIVGEPLDW